METADLIRGTLNLPGICDHQKIRASSSSDIWSHSQRSSGYGNQEQSPLPCKWFPPERR